MEAIKIITIDYVEIIKKSEFFALHSHLNSEMSNDFTITHLSTGTRMITLRKRKKALQCFAELSKLKISDIFVSLESHYFVDENDKKAICEIFLKYRKWWTTDKPIIEKYGQD